MIVDDEEIVLNSLGNFLKLETDYRVTACQSTLEALVILREESIDLIISDYLMPEMNGLQFLSEVKNMYPDAARILLTGYADKENAIKAINQVGLFQYVEKPWDNEQLKLILHNALAHKSLKETLVEKIHQLDEVLLERDSIAQNQLLFKEEMSLARQLQQSILPRSFPVN